MASAIASRSRRAAARCLRVCAARQDRDAIALAILQQAIGRHQQGRVAKDGVEGKVIQELAGHADLTTTMRYMHLAKGSKEAAIAVLDRPATLEERGDLLETQTLAENSRRKSTGKEASPQRFELYRAS